MSSQLGGSTALPVLMPTFTGPPSAEVLEGYLQALASPAALERSQLLAAAYDAACKSLIGPNDIHREGNREFKKKSAWRKLGRHFQISTEVLGVEHSVVRLREEGEADLLAIVRVRATAPWGQSCEAAGACCTDEETGRRVITVADAIATAQTRATNRAVSDLVAMGEVSADELSERREPRKQHGGARGEARREAASEAPTEAQLGYFERLLKASLWTEAQRDYWRQARESAVTKQGMSALLDAMTAKFEALKARAGGGVPPRAGREPGEDEDEGDFPDA